MWKDYSAGFIRNNRGSSISIMTAALISALFLSLLCGLFYNLWAYEVEETVMAEGDWQGRLTGNMDEIDFTVIENFANVEKAVMNQELSDGNIIAVDVYFHNMRDIYQDLPLIAEKLGLEEEDMSYHELLLSGYMIHDPLDENPPLLLALFLGILLVVSLSLVLIIHNSFAVSTNARIHQFGIFSSIGATPGQVLACLMQEAAALCLMPVLAGSLIGIALSYGMIQAMNRMAEGITTRHDAVFKYHPLVFVITMTAAVSTVFASALLPAIKLSRQTPLQAIRGANEPGLKKKKHSRVLRLLFGMEGELAGKALKAQRKALRTSALSLTLSFLGFMMMLCLSTLSGISTNHTYFEKYQDAWDVMVTLKDTEIENWRQGGEVRSLQGLQSSVAYQKTTAMCPVPERLVSDELKRLGGLGTVAGDSVTLAQGACLVKAPVVIMDDNGFEEYCGQIGVTPELNGSIVLNRIWDSLNSNFRYKEYVPFIKEGQDTITLQNVSQDGGTVEIPVLAYTQATPVLREEYDNYTLVQFMPLSLWNQISGQIGHTESDTYIRILGKDKVTSAELDRLETDISQIIGQEYTAEIENRIREKVSNDNMREGFMLISGAFCSLLAVIGIANVFSNTLGFIRQRKREFAQYMSVGMTPEGMRKMFFIEALVIAGRPLLITLPLTVLFAGYIIKTSYLNPMEFLVNLPVVPIVIFTVAVFGFVASAYLIGGKRLLKCSLPDALRDGGMM